MSPASEGSSHSFTYSRPVSQNPNPNFSSNHSHQPQSSCFSIGSDECNGSLNFDFSKMGTDPLEQPRARRLRYPVKKLRRKLGSDNSRRADSLSSESLDQPNENGARTTTTTNTSTDMCGGSVGGKEGGDETGKFRNAGYTFGAKGNSFASNSSSENKGFVFGTCRSSSTSSLSYGDGSFVFGAGKSSAELNYNIGYVADKSSLQSNSNPKNKNVVFGSERSSLSSNLSNEDVDFVVGANKSSFNMKSSLRNVNGVLGVNAGDSTMKSSLEDGNFMFNACTNNTSSSTNLGQMKSSGTMGLSEANKMQNFDNVSFVFRAKKGELSSHAKLEQKGSINISNVQSEVDGSGKFGNVGFVSSSKKMSVAAENRSPEKEDHSDCVCKTIPDMRGKVKLDAREVSEKDGHSSFVLGTSMNDRGEKDNLPFVFCAKGNGSTSTAEMEKSKNSEYAGSADFVAKGKENADTANEFQKADTNGVFVFGCGGKEKLSSNRRNEYGDVINHLNNEKTKNNSDFMPLLNDAMKSNFKFVLGSSSTPGSAFYKIPLSKLFDEMKNLNIDDSEGISGIDKVKDVRSNARICGDHVDAAQNNGQMSSTGKKGTTLPDQHKDANVGGAVKCSDFKKVDMKCGNRGTSEYEHDLQTGNFFRGSVKVTKPVGMKSTNSRSSVEVSCEGVNSSFASAGVFEKENQPSNSSGTTGHVQQNSSSSEAPPPKVENEENLSFTSTQVGPRTSSKEFNAANLDEPSSTTNPFTELNKKFEFFANSASVKEKKLKKTRRKLRQRMPSKPLTGQDHLHKEGSTSKNFESPGGCSPMDFSPYQHCTDGTPASLASERKEGDSTPGRQSFDIHENDKKYGEPHNVNSKGLNESNLKSATSSSAQHGLSAIRRQYRKKYKLRVGDGLNGKSAARNAEFSSSSVQCSTYAGSSFNIDKERVQSGVTSEHTKQDTPEAATHGVCEHWRIRGNQAYKIRDLSKAEEFYTKGINSVRDNHVSGICSEPLLLCYSNRAATRMSLGRMREALDDCKSAAALDPSFPKVKIRAAKQGAAQLAEIYQFERDNCCHLVLGEFQEAMQYYNDCLESVNKICLDRRFTIEAADGLQKAQKVAECMSQSAELMQQRTSDAANSALGIIVDALSISCYSETLLEMKGEALFLLQRYDEVIELCEQTLHIAERNVTANHLANVDDFEYKNSLRLWRWRLMSKCHFHLGRLEVALDLVEKQEQLKSISNRYGSVNPENPIPLAVTIRGLLEHKKVGNEAFQSGKHAEAIEHYTAAISSSVECRPFAAICFCNRAAAHQALGQIVDAIADCSLSIALDGNYPKAISRRATLHEMIRDYKQAIDDLQRLIALLENQLKEKTQKSGKQDGSGATNKKELKQARCRLSLMEDMGKKGTSLDLYLILGIKASDTESDIKKAYRKAALRHHPDKVGQFLARNDGGDDGRLWKDIVEKVHEDADRLFKMIGEAYAVLSDPDKRSKYNYEEEIRDFCSNSNRNMNSRRPSEFYSSPYDGGHWSSRDYDFYGSPSGRSRNRRNWQDSWRSHDNPHSRW